MVDVFVQESVVEKGEVGLPSICYDEGTLANMPLVYRDEGVAVYRPYIGLIYLYRPYIGRI